MIYLSISIVKTVPGLVQKKIFRFRVVLASVFFSPVSAISSFGLYLSGFFYRLWKNQGLSPCFGSMFVQFYIHGHIRKRKVSSCFQIFRKYKKETLGRIMSKVFDKYQFLNTRNNSQELQKGIQQQLLKTRYFRSILYGIFTSSE